MLTSLFVILVMGGVAIAPKSNQIDSFMIALEDCVRLCLLGIEPGTTTVSQTMGHLRNHSWIKDIQQNAPGNGFAQITWGWSGEQPDSIDDSRRGRITFYWDEEDTSGAALLDSVVETVSIYTHIRMYIFQERLGESSIGNVNNRVDGTLGYTVTYNVPGGVTSIVSEMICPVSIVSYWNARARITVSIGRSDSPYISPAEIIQMC